MKRIRTALALMLALVVAPLGCSSPSTSPSPAVDTTAVDADAGRSADVLGDTLDTSAPDVLPPDAVLVDAPAPDVAAGDSVETADTTGDAADAELWEPPPVAPETPLVPLVDLEWRAIYVGNKPGDPLLDAIEAGTFSWQEPGVVDGLWWQDLPPDEAGAWKPPSQNLLFYAVARFEADAPTGLVVRADRMSHVIHATLGSRQPGDPYGHRYHRVPIHAVAGENLIVFRAVGWNGAPEAALWQTDDEVVFNLADLTVPDLVVGEATAQPLGVAVLTTTDAPLLDVTARVMESEHVAATALHYPALGALAATQVAFEVRPKPGALPDPGTPVPVTLRIESPSLAWSYERTVELQVVPAEAESAGAIRRTFVSPVDGSAQYYGLQRPSEGDDPGDPGRALVLSLHGAGVQAIGQAGSYGAKPDAYVVAATNRRPFGFDWELWGRLNALATLDHAMAALPIDPTRVYLSGHSMGGHGTWQLGTLFPGRFAVVGPSAGWISFASYGGDSFSDDAFGWARRSSDTLRYIDNLARRAVYIIHGSADDNVPISEANTMFAALQPIVPDLQFHVEEGAGHWWDGDLGAGADCVDWPPLFETMDERRLDLAELDFRFVTAWPWVSPTHGWLTIRSTVDPREDAAVDAVHAGDAVTVTTTTARGLVLDGAALADRGVATVTVDGVAVAVAPEPLPVGPQTGKTPEVYGPVTAVFFRPHCWVYPDDGPAIYRQIADRLVSTWTIIGNGHACVLPLSALDDETRAARNLIYIGIPRASVPIPEDMAATWDATSVSIGDHTYPGAALFLVFPEAGHLSAVFAATDGAETQLYRIQPFTSRFVIPDYLVLRPSGAAAVGFFDADWHFAPAYGQFAP